MAAIACGLAAYDEWVIVEATHPRTGIQATPNFKAWPPNSGEMKEFCDAMAKKAARYAVYDTLPKPDLVPRIPPPPDTRQGRCANLFVPETSPHYAAMLALIQDADPKDWRFFSGHPTYGNGVKVPLDWLPTRGGALRSTFRQAIPSMDELRKRYAPQEIKKSA